MNKTAKWPGGAVRGVLFIGLVVAATTTLHSQSNNPVQSNSTAVDSALSSLPDPAARIPNAQIPLVSWLPLGPEDVSFKS